MKARILATLRKFLIVLGAISLFAIAGVLTFVSHDFLFGDDSKSQTSKAQIDTASVKDVGFVLNWSGLGASKIEKVIHSYVEHHPFGSLEAYAIKISQLEISELSSTTDVLSRHWYRGDQLPPVVSDAIGWFVGENEKNEIPWFPKATELKSANVYVNPFSICLRDDLLPTSVMLIFVRPSDNMVFYIRSST